MLYYNHGKGRKQNPDPIYSQRERKIPNTRKDKKMTGIKVAVKDGKAELYTPYNADFVKAIKALGGARWNASKRCWTISEDMLTQAREIMMDVYGHTDEEQSETVEVIEESELEKKEKKAVDETTLKEYARRVDHVMRGKNPEIVAVVKKTILDAYSRKAEAVDKTEEEKALAFASGVLYGLYQLKMIEEDRAYTLQKMLGEIFGK